MKNKLLFECAFVIGLQKASHYCHTVRADREKSVCRHPWSPTCDGNDAGWAGSGGRAPKCGFGFVSNYSTQGILG